ncbi:DNA topoisomerase IV [Algoriphagus sp. CAU 1675]|uniref:DNA topoisomerase IV n=1 Tax=Algoriphagus sp. CAU 1675 TaxID=3032597 RepID=UPI0023DBE676|nr:DNA topoisomerase IV [Algoriphagus sp. CAU 1675]MDF2157739.1 DNA topoisomerase IV [Algoriphagus sp. CAU 1675]
MYYRFGKAFYFLSVAFFVFLLLYFYSALPDSVAYQFDEEGFAVSSLSRSGFFYGMVLVFLLINAVVLFPPKMLETKSHRRLHRIFPLGDIFRDYFLTWFYSFGGVVNLSLSLLVFYIHSINNQEEIRSYDLDFVFYLVPFFLIVWIVVLFLLFAGKARQLKSQG